MMNLRKFSRCFAISSSSIFLSLLLTINQVLSTNLETLQTSQIIFRHGARNVDGPYPADPYKDEKFWPEGMQQLTCLGKIQAYHLGQELRKVYHGFIDETFSPQDVYVCSSDLDRTIQTAHSVLAGLFSPDQRVIQKNNQDCESIPWMPVPVHTIPRNIDNLLLQKHPCPKYERLIQEDYDNDEEVKQIIQDNRELIEYFYTQTGFSNSNSTFPSAFQIINNFSSFMDNTNIEIFFNFTLPDWIQNIYKAPAARALAVHGFTAVRPDELSRLKSGGLIERLLANFNLAANPPNITLEESLDMALALYQIPKKVSLFSGHDTTISALFNMLGVKVGAQPNFASVVILELHKNMNKTELDTNDEDDMDQLEVKAYFQDGPGTELNSIELPKCGTPCKYTKFVETAQIFVPLDWKRECQLATGNYVTTVNSVLMWTVSIMLLIVLVIGLVLSIIWVQKRSRKSYEYL